MNELINSYSVQIKEYNGQRVVTFNDIDRVHQRPDGTARRNFNKNKEHFIEGIDFFKITPYEFRTAIGEMDERQQNDITLFTEMGYLMLVKSFRDELSWNVQRQLVVSYFNSQRDKKDAEKLRKLRNDLEIQIFRNEEFGRIRTIVINGETWFVCKDVCQALNLKNPSDVVKKLFDNERAKLELGRQGATWFINESGLYAVILRSNKKEATIFRKWVTSEVLPEYLKKVLTKSLLCDRIVIAK